MFSVLLFLMNNERTLRSTFIQYHSLSEQNILLKLFTSDYCGFYHLKSLQENNFNGNMHCLEPVHNVYILTYIV